MLELIEKFNNFPFGVIAGVIAMFFIANNNPEWISKTFRTLKGKFDEVEKSSRAEVDELKAKIASMELTQRIREEIARAKKE